jgi:hypothetical protein
MFAVVHGAVSMRASVLFFSLTMAAAEIAGAQASPPIDREALVR